LKSDIESSIAAVKQATSNLREHLIPLIEEHEDLMMQGVRKPSEGRP